MREAPKTTATRQFPSCTLARVDPAKLAALREELHQVGRETSEAMRGRPVKGAKVPFHELTGIHYARFVIVEWAGDCWLAFSTNYDGPEGIDDCSERRAFSAHVQELAAKAGPGLVGIFSHCRGFNPDELERFIRRHQVAASTFYVGSSGRSCRQILWERELRQKVDAILDRGGFEQSTPELVRAAVLKALAADYPALPTFPAQPNLESRFTRVKVALIALLVLVLSAGVLGVAFVALTYGIGFGLLAAALLAAAFWLPIARFRWLENNDPQFQPEFSTAASEAFEVAAADENEFLQNQLTHLVPIKPGLLRWLLIRVVFGLLDVLAKNVYNHGKLGDIPSIHFARWVLIPKRGVLFFSNFDNSWASYLGDFIDRANSGLTAVWSNTAFYPRTRWLLEAGARDASRFLAWTRANQRPTQVWYAAYPGLSIVNVNANTEVRRGLADPQCVDATSWLFRLRGVDRSAADAQFSDERRQLPLPMADIQGIILWGYGHVPEARYLLFRVAQPGPALSSWLASLPLTSAEGSRNSEPPEPLNVAFSHAGLRALNVDETLCDSFSVPFVQGSHHPYRARVNGDVGANAPERWQWGSAENPVHVVLLVYAKDKPSVEQRAADLRAQAESAGLLLVAALEGTTLPDRKEHFGFRDGIAQPTVKGAGRGEMEGNLVAAGEFLLGHRDEYDNVAHSPESPAGFAFGRNGSYLVFRQLEQNVEAFWRTCAAHDPHAVPDVAVRTASKLIGRWPSGAPLVRHPDQDPKSPRFADEDTFTYLANDDDNDRYGARCPFGAHIRRSNPRDWLLAETPDQAIELANLHRILRRGRPYGPALEPSMVAEAILGEALRSKAPSEPAKRGLQFLCFNANIDRQFEFVQQAWANNPKFAGQDSDADPVLGFGHLPTALGCPAATFTLQTDVKKGVERRVTNLSNFVRVVGSGYFFMPALPAVKMLAAVCEASAAEGLEQIPPDEQLHIDSLVNALREKIRKQYTATPTLRDAHPKMHGLVKAKFTTLPNLPPELKVGLFSVEQSYDTWVRFSNAEDAAPDSKADIRGAALKLVGVGGPKLLDGAEDGETFDLLLISTDHFFAKDAAQFDAFVQAMGGGMLTLGAFLLTHLGLARKFFSSLQHHTSPLAIRYFGVAPYLLGSRAVKYSLTPVGPPPNVTVNRANPNFLREALKAQLAQAGARFDFAVQLRTDPETMPIEDASVPWRESDAPFHKVATLEIPAQVFDTPARDSIGENLSFNPWRCLPDHRPLGGISRARRQVYRALTSFRHDRNQTPSDEPTAARFKLVD